MMKAIARYAQLIRQTPTLTTTPSRQFTTIHSATTSQFKSHTRIGSSLLSSTHSSISPSLTSSTLRCGGLFQLSIRHATKKAGGSSKNSQDSVGKRLGLKKSAGQEVKVGHILVRQHGKRFHPGKNIGIGRDDTLFALMKGRVAFSYVELPHHKRKRWRKYIHVLGPGETVEQVAEESKEKSKQISALVKLHRNGFWLPSTKTLLLRQRRKVANHAKLAKEQAELNELLAAKDESNPNFQKLKQHPMFAIRDAVNARVAAKKAEIAGKQAASKAAREQLMAERKAASEAWIKARIELANAATAAMKQTPA